jgi:hypothetical protein
MVGWKVLGENRVSHHRGIGGWPEPGTWLEVADVLVPCSHGLHLCRRADLVYWLGPTIWEAEYDEDPMVSADKIVVHRARLVRRLETWTERTARLFACDCAARRCPTDPRALETIAVARRYADGDATADELAAAWDAASAAARDAASDAASAAARAAAWDAERSWQTDLLWTYLYPKGDNHDRA